MMRIVAIGILLLSNSVFGAQSAVSVFPTPGVGGAAFANIVLSASSPANESFFRYDHYVDGQRGTQILLFQDTHTWAIGASFSLDLTLLNEIVICTCINYKAKLGFNNFFSGGGSQVIEDDDWTETVVTGGCPNPGPGGNDP